MPCDQIQRQSISFEHAKGHLDLLVGALEERGYSVVRRGSVLQFSGKGVTGSYSNGKFETSGYSRFNVDEVKQSFAKQVVKKAAKQFGWTVTSNGNKMQIRKRV